jgi:Protein of unknown function (DUF2568)
MRRIDAHDRTQLRRPVAKTLPGIGAPLLAAVVWGLFAAPRATFSAPVARVAVEVAVLGSDGRDATTFCPAPLP